MAPHALSQDLSGWSDKTVCRLVKSDSGAAYVKEASSRGLDCEVSVKATGSNTSGSEYGNKSSYQIIEFEGQIPLLQKHSLSPVKGNSLITNTQKFDYPNCSDSIKSNRSKYPFSVDIIESKFSLLATEDINDVIDFSDGEGDDGGISDEFAHTIHKAHMHCLRSNSSGCGSIMTAMEMLSDKNAFTKNTKSGDTPVTYFVTNLRILKPLLAAYSTVSQRVGRHEKDLEFKDWMQQAIFQNTHNPFAPKGNKDRDLAREKMAKAKGPLFVKMGMDPAQNHSLQSGLIAMMYGVLWQDEHMYHVGLDSYLVTLKSINSEGAFTLEAVRGGSGMFYSGGTLHTLLQIYEIAKNQKHDLADSYPETANLHRAATFLLDVVENEEIILKYAKANKSNGMCKTYKIQCFHGSTRDGAFGWIRLYMKNFPKHQNTLRILGFYEELVSKKPIDTRRKENLNGVIKGNFDHKPFRHNLTYLTKWDEQDSYAFKSFPNDTNVNIGGTKCLYDRVPKG